MSRLTAEEAVRLATLRRRIVKLSKELEDARREAAPLALKVTVYESEELWKITARMMCRQQRTMNHV